MTTPDQTPQQPAAPQYAAPQQPAAPQYAAPQQPVAPPQFATPPHAAPGFPAYPGDSNVPGGGAGAVPGNGLPGPGEPFNGASNPEDLSRPLYGATFGQAVTRFFKNYVKFDGRASRSEFWWPVLFQILISLVPYVLLAAGQSGPAQLLSSAISLGVLLPSLAITWRRLHDANMSGGWFFIALFPILGMIALLVLLCLSPNPAGRRFDR